MMPLSHHAPAAAARKAHLPALGPPPTGGLVWHRHFKGRGGEAWAWLHGACTTLHSYIQLLAGMDRLMLSTEVIDKKRCVGISWPRAVRRDALEAFSTPGRLFFRLAIHPTDPLLLCSCAKLLTRHTSITHLRCNCTAQPTDPKLRTVL